MRQGIKQLGFLHLSLSGHRGILARVTLNILLSFAQFEREVTGERIRDKFAASRAKGMWMGGFVPWGYDVIDRKLVINEAEAAQVRAVFQRFTELGSATLLTRELVAKDVRTKRGKPIDKGFLYKLFRWHARSFCEKSGEYRDFVISRIIETRQSRSTQMQTAADVDWDEIVQLEIGPHPALSQNQKRVIELDYGMQNGRVVIAVRRALLYYALKRLGLDTDLHVAATRAKKALRVSWSGQPTSLIRGPA